MTLFEEIMDKYGVQYTGIDVLEKLNDAYPKKTSIRLDSKIISILYSSNILLAILVPASGMIS